MHFYVVGITARPNTMAREVVTLTSTGAADQAAAGPALVIGTEVWPAWRLRTLVGRYDPTTSSGVDVDLTAQDRARRVSRCHAEFLWVNGTIHLRDLGSTNGTCLNDRRLEAFLAVPLTDGDGVEFGSVRGVFRATAPWPNDLAAEWDACTLTGSLVSAFSLPAESSVATLLFVDVVGSTQEAVRMGGWAWKGRLADFYTTTRRSVTRHRGREVARTGDGILAIIDSPEAAIRCALEIRERVKDLRLELRCGLHYGQFESLGGEISGATVHVAARICARATAGEILVSRTMVELSVGSGLPFTDRGPQVLKGVPGRWRLYSCSDPRPSGAAAG
ncbi:MAG: hypothetical protein NVS3B24_23530 [Candidatus Dormibacteria bacterium]